MSQCFTNCCCFQGAAAATREEPTETSTSQKREERLRKFRELHFKRVSCLPLSGSKKHLESKLYLVVVASWTDSCVLSLVQEVFVLKQQEMIMLSCTLCPKSLSARMHTAAYVVVFPCRMKHVSSITRRLWRRTRDWNFPPTGRLRKPGWSGRWLKIRRKR